jgi:hypothetical protein
MRTDGENLGNVDFPGSFGRNPAETTRLGSYEPERSAQYDESPYAPHGPPGGGLLELWNLMHDEQLRY